MKKTIQKSRRVHGIDAPPVRPTLLGAVVAAGLVTFPVAVIILCATRLLR
jgi:hypothetical protein